ncbi:MAG: hypothetical protein A2147_09180 [Chloroflexi bacterium RBG_16_57_8]|nr:MAG: hypothetical protein A2147_09180 [Chloroflexi bacterium RBG_16_57_8]
MPKPKHRRGKYSAQRRPQAVAPGRPGSPQPPAASTQQAAVRPKATAPPAPAPMALPLSYSTISTELKTIGILAGVMLVALIVIALMLA